MAVDLQVQFHPDDLMSYNTVAEIPGSDLKEEIVMLGAHLDSWHAGTGATDNGAGRIRGIYMKGNEALRPLFRGWLEPFRDLAAETITVANTSGTDHVSFDSIGLPGFQFIQDPLDYGSRTHHSNEDVLDRIQPEDLKQIAVILAAFVYDAANLDHKLSRKPVE